MLTSIDDGLFGQGYGPDESIVKGDELLLEIEGSGVPPNQSGFDDVGPVVEVRAWSLVAILSFSHLYFERWHSGKSLYPYFCALLLLLFFWLKWAEYLAVPC